MVEYQISLDSVFGSLSHWIRRDILERAAKKELSVGEIAQPYNISLAAISKHLKILEKARLIVKRRQGKQLMITASPVALSEAAGYLEHYRRQWEQRLDSLDAYLKTIR